LAAVKGSRYSLNAHPPDDRDACARVRQSPARPGPFHRRARFVVGHDRIEASGLRCAMVAAMTVRDYRIRLDGIRFRSKHGASISERRLPQDFVANVELSFPPSALPGGDERGEVVDYDRIASAIVQEGTSRSCRLLETLARRIVERLFTDFPATSVRIVITKARPPTSSSVESASIELLVARREKEID
jgi:7,8-dihydroneopterin aldolase/epimerase/oxygenase